ncbi:YceI family protein [Lutibacter sp. A64]|uniref:YceI family protein n=1 Tax=Lutibacter sp. A64 TaxID=2918526 RepID=UPI001F07008D|nr:YceI family protein [Lutibacter sp. A64]UMB53975.1 YceI family protein [Lutibacter sp. A64]
MKNNYLKLLFVLTLTLVVSCKNTPKKEQISTEEKGYTVDQKTTTVNWIAYKTNDKIPVKGQFTELNLENSSKSKTALEALDNLKFSIPVSSLFTNDTIRDNKLKKFFFGALKNTTLISGTIHINNETSGTVDILMNGITQALPITFIVSDQMITLEAVMDLDNWQAQSAIDSLNEVCKELHTGSDGISKTWSEVKIEVATYLKYE